VVRGQRLRGARRFERLVRAELDADATVVATGGLAPLLIAESQTITHHAPDLTLRGLRMVYERNIG